MKRLGYFVFLLLAFPLLASCGGPGSESEPSIEPEIRVFNVSPDVADAQATVVMSWDTDAESVEIEGIGMVPPSGSREMTADTSKVFTIIARVRDIVRTAQARLTVRPGPGNDPPVGPDPIPTPIPDPGPIPPPPSPDPNACVENPGVSFGVTGKANNMGPIVAPDENTVVFFYTTTEPDGSFVKFNMTKSIDGGVTFSTKPFREFSANGFIPNNGSVSAILTSSGGNILNLIWVNSANNSYKLTFNRSYDLGETWTSDVVIPDSPVAGSYDRGLVSHGSNLYFFYTNGTDANKLWANMSQDNGQSWGVAKVVYESSNTQVGAPSVSVDGTGKVYVFFAESPIWPAVDAYMSLATSIDQGITWDIKRSLSTVSNIGLGHTIASNGTIYRIAGPNFTVTEIQSMTDPAINWENSAWTTVTNIPTEVSSKFDNYSLNLRNGGFTILGLAKQCTASTGRTLRPIVRADYMNGIWTSSIVQSLDINGTTIPNFSGAVTPGGIVHTLLQRNVAGGLCSPNCPTELWLGKDP